MNRKFLFALLALSLLTVLISACRIVDASTLPKSKVVRMGSSDFIDKEVSIGKGETISMVDTLTSHHVLVNGYWESGSKQVTQAEPGAPTVNGATNSTGDSVIAGPFTTAGDFKIYCNVHPLMNLVVHVK